MQRFRECRPLHMRYRQKYSFTSRIDKSGEEFKFYIQANIPEPTTVCFSSMDCFSIDGCLRRKYL